MADEKVTVVKSGGSGVAVALIAVAVIAALVVLFLMFGQKMLNGSQPIKADVKIENPVKTN